MDATVTDGQAAVTPVGDGAVTLLVVSHDGATWLPGVVAAIRALRVGPRQVVCVDTGSTDAGPELLVDLGPVLRAPATSGFGAAVRVGLEHLRDTGRETEWLWLLHDDAAPAPDALGALLAATAEHPGADVLGPKLREWPSLLRLLEVGVTVTGTGVRETGLEPGEYDQGQHDEIRAVLAVNTAGMLVRRGVLERLGGLEEQLPVFGADLDLGWRAAAAGVQTLVVPGAVVFHAEAARRGLRRTPLTGAHPHREERRAALFTLLANSRPGAPWLQVPRLALGTVLRVLGLLAVRDPARALDDVAALASVLRRPGVLRRARRLRAASRTVPPREVRPLLAPAWLPYRHGLDLLADLGSAVSQQAGDVAERRRAAAAGSDPSSFAARRIGAEEAQGAEGAGEDTGAVARFVTNPVAVVLALVVVLLLVATRGALGDVAGGGLSPAPASAGEWWDLLLQTRHPLAQGTSVPAPAYLLPLALLGTLLGGSAAAALALVMWLAVPAALWGAWRFLRVLGRLVSLQGAPRWLILWGSTTYALTPLVSGAWTQGRLGPVVATAGLPWLAHAALGFADPDADRRWRAGWRAGLLAALVTAFAPLLALVLLVLVAVVLGVGLATAPDGVRQRSVWVPLAVTALAPWVLLAPWWVEALRRGAAEGLLLDIGRLPQAALDPLGLLVGRWADLAVPSTPGLVLVVLALLALLPRRSRVGVVVCWLVAALLLVLAALLAPVSLDLAATSAGPGTGPVLVLVQACLVIAVVLAGQAVGARAGSGLARPGARSGPAVVATAALVVAAVAVPLTGLGWFLVDPAPRPQDVRDAQVPAYMVQSSELGPAHGVLVLTGSEAEGLTYTVRRGDGTTLGEDEIIALTPEDRRLTADVRDLAARPTPAVVDTLAGAGIEYVVLPAPADPDVAAALDATTGLVQASAGDRRTRAWQVDRPLDAGGIEARRTPARTVVVGLQGLAVVVVLVLCAPTRRRRT